MAAGLGGRRRCAAMAPSHSEAVNQKYALLPAFLQAKGLIRQHVSRWGPAGFGPLFRRVSL